MDVDASNQRDVWLVKVPKYMANTWKNAPQKAELGKLQIPKGGVGAVKFIQQQDSSEHFLNLKAADQQRLVILSQSGDGIAFEGNVKYRGQFNPIVETSCTRLKTSIKTASEPTRITKVLDKAVTSYKPRGATQLAHEADLRKKKEESKKIVREDKDVVQGRLFAAFEKQKYYNIKDLVRITNQSIPYLKDILKDICNYCSKRKLWELKPEYRHYKDISG